MSLGNEWKERLGVEKTQNRKLSETEKASVEKDRAEEIIFKLLQHVSQVNKHRCLVMKLEYLDIIQPQRFDGLYGKKFVSSDRFLRAAKIVVEYCLANDLDVYVWEEDFSLALRENIGAEIWVTPHGVLY